MTPARSGIIVGALLSAVFYLVYTAVLHEPGSLFYGFAALVFIGCPLVAGAIAMSRAQRRRPRQFLTSGGAVFAITLVMFIVTYAVLPQFDRTSVQLPAACDGFDGVLALPSQLAYTLPGGKSGTLLAQSEDTVVVAAIDGEGPPFGSTAYIIRKTDNAILKEMSFNSDVVMASIDTGTVYIYNDKLGYLIDERTGAFEANILLIDNYGGLSETDRPVISRAASGNWYFETSAVVSSWSASGRVKSRPHLAMNGIARGCYVSGVTGEVIPLGPQGQNHTSLLVK